MIRLLQISDIHLLCKASELDNYTEIRRSMIKDLTSYRNRYGSIDHILICGDIAFAGKKNEYDKAKTFLGKIAEAVGSSNSHIYMVPGNHDKDLACDASSLRMILNAGFTYVQKPDDLLADELEKEFSTVKHMYKPFNEYNNFAFEHDCNEPLMQKCFDPKDKAPYNNELHKMYWHHELENENGYKFVLYGVNSAFNSDLNDYDGKSNGHLLFLPKLAYNAEVDNDSIINILMAHHPLKYVINSEQIQKTIDEKYAIQFYGHEHVASSTCDTTVRIFSGALQPHEVYNQENPCFPVYNVIELEVKKGDPSAFDELYVKLRVQKWNKEAKSFESYKKQSKTHKIILQKSNDIWEEGDEEVKTMTNLPDGVDKRDVKVAFLRSRNPRIYINDIKHGFYDDKLSGHTNCLNFLKYVESENCYEQLWNLLNK